MNIKLVNTVAGGDLGSELDLEELFEHFESDERIHAEYNPNSFAALLLRNEVDGPLFMLYRTGKFVIIGAESETQLDETYNNLMTEFRDLDEIDQENPKLDIYNKVFKTDLDRKLDLSAFAIHLGFERVEYEPEQSPFLVYRSSEQDGVITVAGSGKAVINGVQTEDKARDLFQELSDNIESVPETKI